MAFYAKTWKGAALAGFPWPWHQRESGRQRMSRARIRTAATQSQGGILRTGLGTAACQQAAPVQSSVLQFLGQTLDQHLFIGHGLHGILLVGLVIGVLDLHAQAIHDLDELLIASHSLD